ncbi:MAG: isoprenyl transferase [Candidatus Saganbacteria bacterium]|nr:isoprenyl transferase [Candidatus Saganbacteria bacterium]
MLSGLLSIFKKKTTLAQFSRENIPIHVAIIMDGNGRWAKGRGLPRIAGHKVGAESVRSAVKTCAELGIKYLTLYAFSTENWKRPKEEVSFLMGLLTEYISSEIPELRQNKVRIRFLGRIQELPIELQEKIRFAESETKNNTRLNVQVMLNYGGRAEIVDALNAINNEQSPNDTINEELIGKKLYTAGIPDPDLLIRTANEMRVSNFLLWQIAYAEFYVTKTLWPDFRREHLVNAVQEYQKRKRKFGALG